MKITNIQPALYNTLAARKSGISFSGSPSCLVNSIAKSKGKRKKELEEIGMSQYYAQQLARLPKKLYRNAILLYSLGVYEECIEDTSKIYKEKTPQILGLIENKVIDENLYPLANLDEPAYSRIIELRQKGTDSDVLNLFADLDEEQFSKANKYMTEGKTPVEAAYMARLTEDELERLKRYPADIDIETVAELAILDDDKQPRCIDLLNRGILPEDIRDIALLDDDAFRRTDELIAHDVGDDNIAYLAKLSAEDYKKALELFKNGVIPEYITDIIKIEKGETKNSSYDEAVKRGCSRSSAFALSILTPEEMEVVSSLIESHPQIRDVLKDEYDIFVITGQNDNEPEVIFTKDVRLNNGTKIKFAKTFSKNGISTKSRLEEYKNHSTSSKLTGKSDIYRIKYGKSGSIKEMTEFIQNPDTHDVEGVLYSASSDILPGAYETTYFDIADFKTGGDESYTNKPIKESVISKGKTVSSVCRNNDGSISYNEHFQRNGCDVQRYYNEKQNESGKIQSSVYSYRIKDENNNVLADINRKFVRNADCSAKNIINGNEYRIEYDDDSKRVIISCDGKEKVLDFGNKLAFYYKDKLWDTIKTLQTDTLLTFDRNIENWNYCRDTDSCADGKMKILSSSTSAATILHETGHFKDYEIGFISDNPEFDALYTEEMRKFQKEVPFNEQNFVQYFSPRAEMSDAVGKNEFIAESNVLLTTYSHAKDKYKTRVWMLGRYFPRTIAKIAEISGKSSTKNILDD